jgi:hypothetical protein
MDGHLCSNAYNTYNCEFCDGCPDPYPYAIAVPPADSESSLDPLMSTAPVRGSTPAAGRWTHTSARLSTTRSTTPRFPVRQLVRELDERAQTCDHEFVAYSPTQAPTWCIGGTED